MPKKAKSSKSKGSLPVWYHPDSPLGSAVRYVAGLSGRYNWVGIYVLKGKTLVLGPYIGEATEHKRIPVGRGVCGLAVSLGKTQNVPDVSNHQNYLACSTKTRSELVVLVRNRRNQVVGQIDIDSHTLNAFGPEEQAAIEKVATELGELWPA
ncbi:MAG: GAF domain-containing protein [Bdellovibrionales bacterium]|nr:GAF domain-containing protein [Bdellovibrionales bacterium]